MIDLQELIARGRFLFNAAPQRLKLFELVNGRRSTGQLAKQLHRHVNSINRDIRLLADGGLIQPRKSLTDKILRVEGLPIYEKVPLARTVPTRYFKSTSRIRMESLVQSRRSAPNSAKQRLRTKSVQIPNSTEILDICKRREDQTVEFKAQGTAIERLVHEIAAMLNTSMGGMILLGVDDNGAIQGAGISRPELDQPLQNSVRNKIKPSPTIRLAEIDVLGSAVIVIMVPPWDGKRVYELQDHVYIRKGTNAFQARPEEIGRLYQGQTVV